MPSSLKETPAPSPNLAEFPAVEWRAVPGQEPDTVLKAPRSEGLESPPMPGEIPSVWRRLFPTSSDGLSPFEGGTEPAQGVSLGHFTIERRIGAGAMGAVFLAYDERLRREVALKVLSPQQASDPATVQRFQNEAQAAARLDHEHIARVYYYGEEQNLHFIAYEYVPGINLRDLLRQRGRLTPAETVNYALQIATALRHTSRCGVVHRDIKPSNIIVTGTGRAKLVDLGLAKRDSSEPGNDLTVAGTTLGTFDYISPEQARDPRSVDVRSDLYSLGCTMYHLLTGEPPYPAGTVLQKLLDHQAQDTPEVLSKNRHVPPALSALIRKLMASDPRRRYATPDELLRDLAVIARGLGLRVISSDSATLVPEARLKGSWWEQNFGWMVTAAALILIVGTLQAVPGVWDHITAWTGGISSLSNPPVAPLPSETPSSVLSPTVNESSVPQKPATPETIAHTIPSPPSAIDDVVSLGGGSEKTAARPGPESKLGSGTGAREAEPSPEGKVASPSVSSGAKPAEPTAPAITIIGSDVSYATLEQACAEARDGQVIELRFDGLRSVSDRTLRLTNKRLTIRGAQGYRPLLEFSDAGRSSDPSVTRWIAVTGGTLQLVNLDLSARIPASVTGGAWVLFSLERPEQLLLDRVTVTLSNPRRRQASVIEFGTSAAASGMVKSGLPTAPPEIQLSKCVVRGFGGLITIREAISARFAIEDSLIALEEPLLQIASRPSMNAGESSPIKFDLMHNTIILGGSLIVSRQDENLDDRQIPLLVTAKNNLISVAREMPLVDLSGNGDAMEIRDSFVWSGERNGYDDIRAFWIIRSRQSVNPPLDFHAWRELWGGEASGSWNGPIRWRQPIRQVALHQFLPEQAELEPNPAINPAVKGAADGTDLGAPLEELPIPPQFLSERNVP